MSKELQTVPVQGLMDIGSCRYTEDRFHIIGMITVVFLHDSKDFTAIYKMHQIVIMTDFSIRFSSCRLSGCMLALAALHSGRPVMRVRKESQESPS